LKSFALAWVVLAGCGREPLSFTIDQDVDGAASPPDGGALRAPKKHRAAGSPCPSERAPNSPPECAPGAGNGIPVQCRQDSDCTMGDDGRCLRALIGPARCGGLCSYDECAGDSDCAAPAPCECRASAMSTAPNTCVRESNCRVDADCGPGGFCSPSVVAGLCDCPSTDLCDATTMCTADGMKVPCACGDACGHGYFCHTPHDTCLDDADCADQGTCNYDRLKNNWACAICWPIP
jgi:hypothetical protein